MLQELIEALAILILAKTDWGIDCRLVAHFPKAVSRDVPLA